MAALKLLAQTLAPFAPHAAEGLLLLSGEQDGEALPGPWPERLDLSEISAGRAPARDFRQLFLSQKTLTVPI